MQQEERWREKHDENAKSNTHVNGDRTDVQISIQTIMGKIRLHLPARTVELSVGQLLVLGSAVPHDVEAIEESAFLLTAGSPHVAPKRKFRHGRSRPHD